MLRTIFEPSLVKVAVHRCDQCEATFASCHALNTHCIMVHKRRREINRYAFDHMGSVCPCCQVDFRSTVRLANHLSRGALECTLFARLGGLPLASEEDLERRTLDEREVRRRARAHGLAETAGPPAKWPTTTGDEKEDTQGV